MYDMNSCGVRTIFVFASVAAQRMCKPISQQTNKKTTLHTTTLKSRIHHHRALPGRAQHMNTGHQLSIESCWRSIIVCRNRRKLCESRARIHSFRIWSGSNPLHFIHLCACGVRLLSRLLVWRYVQRASYLYITILPIHTHARDIHTLTTAFYYKTSTARRQHHRWGCFGVSLLLRRGFRGEH